VAIELSPRGLDFQSNVRTIGTMAKQSESNATARANLAPAPVISPDNSNNGPENGPENSSGAGVAEGPLGILFGLIGASLFYLFAWAVPLAPIERYFLGHPVAVAATYLFAIALAILTAKILRVRRQTRLTDGLRDEDLLPGLPPGAGDADRWLAQNDAGRVARWWLDSLDQLTPTTRRSPLVNRLAELLGRQSNRASTRHLSDDLREVSARELDTAYDSLQLVRIIIWAIPMLGFLGTVIGITQTLGGLDFTDGSAAVDRLKIGLYVAFDTTALGLVLSVVAIFLQFPVERSEQLLLAEIDRRVGKLLADRLPSDDHADNPAAQIALLCDGIRVAVSQSLASQAELWRNTIDEAQEHWRRVADDGGQRISQSMLETLSPVLQVHSRAFDDHADALREHSQSLAQIEQQWGEEISQRWNHWNAAVEHRHHQWQQESRATERVGDGLADAMLTLARAVDVLSQHLPPAGREALAEQWDTTTPLAVSATATAGTAGVPTEHPESGPGDPFADDREQEAKPVANSRRAA